MAGEIRPSMTSNLLARSSLKRKATQTPPAIHQVQIKKKRSVKPSVYSSTLQKAQNSSSVAPLPSVVSQAATVPSLSQPISSVPPVTRTARSLPPLTHKVQPSSPLSQATPAYLPLVRTSPIPPSARMSPSPHLKWQGTSWLLFYMISCATIFRSFPNDTFLIIFNEQNFLFILTY